MAGIIKVNQYQDFNGNTLFTSDGNGNLTTMKTNYPAFEVYLSSNQAISHNSATKVQFDTEILDTNNTYDNSTNYRFTPNVAGKYYVYSGVNISNSSNELQKARAIIYKNGSEYRRTDNDGGTSGTEETMNEFVSAIIDLNGSSDYIEIFTLIFQDSGTTNVLGASYRPTYFGAYRIGS